ncbi:MAG: hypothetical protein ACJ8DW_00645 [Microvirga sp.]
MGALSGGFAALFGNLFGFLLSFFLLLLDPVLRRSFFELDAVAPCALKSLEWWSHLYSGISTARLRPAPGSAFNRTGATWRASRSFTLGGVTIAGLEEVVLG